MYRNRAYRRNKRNNKIKHKSYIAQHIFYWNTFTPGKFNKGKVHCSCPMCATKSKKVMGARNKSIYSYKHSDVQKHLSAIEQLNEVDNGN